MLSVGITGVSFSFMLSLLQEINKVKHNTATGRNKVNDLFEVRIDKDLVTQLTFLALKSYIIFDEWQNAKVALPWLTCLYPNTYHLYCNTML